MKPNCPRRMLYHATLMLDTNCINARGRDPVLNQIDKWKENGVILVVMSKPSYGEALDGGSRNRGRKVMSQIFILPIDGDENDRSTARKIELIIFPCGCKNQNERNDVDTVLDAKKHPATLITRDGGSKSQPGGILGNRDRLRDEIGVVILRPEEAVSCIKKKIRDRDELTRFYAKRAGKPLPDWVGQD